MGVAQKLPAVVPLERLGELVEEVDEGGGGLVRELQWQTDDREVIRLHGRISWSESSFPQGVEWHGVRRVRALL